jgi:hypothetical protein
MSDVWFQASLFAVIGGIVLMSPLYAGAQVATLDATRPAIRLPVVILPDASGRISSHQQVHQVAPCSRRVGKVVMATTCSEGVLGKGNMLLER